MTATVHDSPTPVPEEFDLRVGVLMAGSQSDDCRNQETYALEVCVGWPEDAIEFLSAEALGGDEEDALRPEDISVEDHAVCIISTRYRQDLVAFLRMEFRCLEVGNHPLYVSAERVAHRGDDEGLEETEARIECTGGCGDGNVTVGEECDDGNNLSGDGCSSDCRVEGDVGLPPTDFDWIVDAEDDFVDSMSRLEAAYRDGKVDLIGYASLRAAITSAQVAAWMSDGPLGCGVSTPGGRVVCPDGVDEFPPGELVAVAMQLASEVPAGEADRSFIYSAVFDSDGVAGNDWVFRDPYDWDYFQGCDRWYQLIWDHLSSEWYLSVTQVDETQTMTDVSSAARAIINGDIIIYYLPASELPGVAAGYRVTAFGHDGSFTESSRGGDVSGDDPTESLTPL